MWSKACRNGPSTAAVRLPRRPARVIASSRQTIFELHSSSVRAWIEDTSWRWVCSALVRICWRDSPALRSIVAALIRSVEPGCGSVAPRLQRLQGHLLPGSDVADQVLGGPIATSDRGRPGQLLIRESGQEGSEPGLADLQGGDGVGATGEVGQARLA